MSRVEPPAGSEDVCCPGERQLPPCHPRGPLLAVVTSSSCFSLLLSPRVWPPKHPHFTTHSSSTFDQPSTPRLRPATSPGRPPRLHSTATCREMDSLASTSNPHYTCTPIDTHARIHASERVRACIAGSVSYPSSVLVNRHRRFLRPPSSSDRSSPFSFPFLRTRVSRVRTFRGYSLGIERSSSLFLSLFPSSLPAHNAAGNHRRVIGAAARMDNGVQRTVVYFSWTETPLTLPVSLRRSLFRARANARPRNCRAFRERMKANDRDRSVRFSFPRRLISPLISVPASIKLKIDARVGVRHMSTEETH